MDLKLVIIIITTILLSKDYATSSLFTSISYWFLDWHWRRAGNRKEAFPQVRALVRVGLNLPLDSCMDLKLVIIIITTILLSKDYATSSLFTSISYWFLDWHWRRAGNRKEAFPQVRALVRVGLNLPLDSCMDLKLVIIIITTILLSKDYATSSLFTSISYWFLDWHWRRAGNREEAFPQVRALVRVGLNLPLDSCMDLKLIIIIITTILLSKDYATSSLFTSISYWFLDWHCRRAGNREEAFPQVRALVRVGLNLPIDSCMDLKLVIIIITTILLSKDYATSSLFTSISYWFLDWHWRRAGNREEAFPQVRALVRVGLNLPLDSCMDLKLVIIIITTILLSKDYATSSLFTSISYWFLDWHWRRAGNRKEAFPQVRALVRVGLNLPSDSCMDLKLVNIIITTILLSKDYATSSLFTSISYWFLDWHWRRAGNREEAFPQVRALVRVGLNLPLDSCMDLKLVIIIITTILLSKDYATSSLFTSISYWFLDWHWRRAGNREEAFPSGESTR